MTTKDFLKKYPNTNDGCGKISLYILGNITMNYNYLILQNDYNTLKLLGLTNWLVDMKHILDSDWLRKEREKKIKRILKI